MRPGAPGPRGACWWRRAERLRGAGAPAPAGSATSCIPELQPRAALNDGATAAAVHNFFRNLNFRERTVLRRLERGLQECRSFGFLWLHSAVRARGPDWLIMSD